MKAITLWQPWASLIAIGAKQYETRSWAARYRGPIAIHAAKKDPGKLQISGKFEAARGELEKAGLAWCLLPTGCIVATAELVNCWRIGTNTGVVSEKEKLFGDWTPGRYAWELANVQMLPEPIPAKGKQGLWNWGAKS